MLRLYNRLKARCSRPCYVNHFPNACVQTVNGTENERQGVIMKTSVMIGLAVLTVGIAAPALASDGFFDRLGNRIERRLDNRGDRINERLDAKGDRIRERLDARADQARAEEKPRLADRLDRRGDRIDQRLDRRGDRMDARLHRRGDRIENRLDRRDWR